MREPLLSLDRVPNNLPDQLTSFVGREHELELVTEMLGETRLLTLTGAGGCGKTRLAAQAGADTLERFDDGVWWLELAPLADGDALAQTVGVRPLPGQTSLQAAIAHGAQRAARATSRARRPRISPSFLAHSGDVLDQRRALARAQGGALPG
jgi:predicted ATPase